MTKHFCDVCGKEEKWRHMVRIHAEREGVSCVISPINCDYELCNDCFERAFTPEKDEKAFENTDVTKRNCGYYEMEYWVVCPNCKTELYLESRKVPKE